MLLAHTAWDLQSVLGRPVHPRARQPDQAAHHQALLDALEPPRAAHARDDPGRPRHLGLLAQRHQAGVPGRLLHPHADDAVLLPGPTGPGRRWRAQGLPGRGRRADDGGGRRGLRRVHLPRLHDRALPAGGHAPGAGAGPGEGRQDAGGLRDRRAELRGHRATRGGDGRGRRRHPPADRVLRLDPGVPRRARPPRLGRPAGRAERLVQAGPVGADGRADRRRHPQHLRSRGRAGRRRARSCSAVTATSSSGSASTRRTRPTRERWQAIIAALKAA